MAMETGADTETAPPPVRGRKTVRRRGRIVTVAAAVAAAGLFIGLVSVTPPSHADTDPSPGDDHAPTVVPIDLLLAGSYTDTTREAIAIWNRAVPSIRFVEQSTPAALRVEEIKSEDGHQTRVDPVGLGRGQVYFDTAKPELYEELGYTPLRIAVHELGHMLSLNDFTARADCAKVMALPGPDCANHEPDAAERAAVAEYFAHHELGDPMPDWPVDDRPGDTATPAPSDLG